MSSIPSKERDRYHAFENTTLDNQYKLFTNLVIVLIVSNSHIWTSLNNSEREKKKDVGSLLKWDNEKLNLQ